MPEECTLLPGAYGVLMQGALFLCACGVLVAKKVTEAARRSWWSFGLDSSKQIAGAGWVHGLNMLAAHQLHSLLTADDRCDQCDWYWINIMIDTTLGVVVEYALLRALEARLPSLLGGEADEFRGGHYYDLVGVEPVFHWRRYAKQMGLWLLVVTLMKASMVLLMLLCRSPLEAATRLALGPLGGDPTVKLTVVMLATPLCMNAFQFLTVDAFIRRQDT